MPDDSFKEFVLDQLSALPELRGRAMFGGHGLYSGDSFFGILFAGRLYFKVDDTNRAAYSDRGMEPFTFEKDGRTLAMNYYAVPPEILEDREELLAWARQSVDRATAQKQRSPARRKRA